VCISTRCSCVAPEQLTEKYYHLTSASRTFYTQLEGGKLYSCTLTLTSALDEGGWLTPRPSRFTPGKNRYPLCRRLDGPQSRSGGVRKISPTPGFDSRTVQPVASCYPGPQKLPVPSRKCRYPTAISVSIGANFICELIFPVIFLTCIASDRV